MKDSPAPRHTNKLIDETSPYLLQHAHNPVNWFAWGEDAFATARKLNKPIFLSVGYSTCYWCHVMERQSFENETIAAEMNARFINIKVDREERPDVDQLYMTAVQVLTQHGGWPMSVFLTPDLRPFYGGTYFPPTDTQGRPGFLTVLRSMDDAFHNRKSDVAQAANQLQNILQQLAEPEPADQPIRIDEALIDALVARSIDDFDPVHGGFGSAPKFPRETLVEMLLAHHARRPEERIAAMLRQTLDAMANGGIRDHLGGGFHRYSTDAKWLVPHFEIMLYDNAMLGWCYAEASRQLNAPRYADVARKIFDFIEREMTSPEGAFYTALDAEVDAREGDPYLWTAEEITDALGSADAKLFSRIYGVDRGPNFADPHGHNSTPDRNVLFRAVEPSADEELRLVAMREKLYALRRSRKQPLLDTKIITSWNALMIRALAHGGEVLSEPRYAASASRAADFLMARHRRADGTLYRTSRNGNAKHDAFLDDYSFLTEALIALKRPDEARSIIATMQAKFAAPNGGFYFTAAGADDLIVRQMIATDSPLPSGNAAATRALTQLEMFDVAERTISSFASQLQRNAEGMSAMLQATEAYVSQRGSVVVQARSKRPEPRPRAMQDVAAGIVALSFEWVSPLALRIDADIRDGFHINANEPGDQMIATKIQVIDSVDASVEYPPGEMHRVDFSEQPVRVYQGRVSFMIKLGRAAQRPFAINFTYQACDDSSCLAPVMKRLDIGAPT